jgi:hypothetical protein
VAPKIRDGELNLAESAVARAFREIRAEPHEGRRAGTRRRKKMPPRLPEIREALISKPSIAVFGWLIDDCRAANNNALS